MPSKSPTRRLGSRRGAPARRKQQSTGSSRPLGFVVGIVSLFAFGYYYTDDPLLTSTLAEPNARQEQQQVTKPLVKVQEIRQEQQVAAVASNSSSSSDTPVVIGYAVSLIKCGDVQSFAGGLTDAALVLRHSLHKTSVRTPESGSKYDYKFYAIVHAQAAECAQILADADFDIWIRPAPVNKTEIRGDFLRANIHKEWCCGSDEFVKLFAYQMTQHPIVVHVDLDFIFHKPMDNLFDAMLLEDSAERKAVRDRIPLERPTDVWPERVNAFMTRDWPQVIPGRKAAYQAGFLVARPDPKLFQLFVDVILEGNFVEGYGRDNGWGGKGYGAFVGAMAAQGLWAYVYDELLPGTWMELNQCRFNHMGMDVRFREGGGGFQPRHKKVGDCRNNLEDCEDCMDTELDLVYNIHYTMCRKPFQCISKKHNGTKGGKESIPVKQVHFDHCMKLLKVWHSYRSDFEKQLYELTNDKSILDGQSGNHNTEFFEGHCQNNSEYLPISARPDSYKRVHEMYL